MSFQPTLPSAYELRLTAEELMEHIQNVNTDDEFMPDTICDTLAVGVTEKEICIAGNLKERRLPLGVVGEELEKISARGGRSARCRFVNFGLTAALTELLLQKVTETSLY